MIGLGLTTLPVIDGRLDVSSFAQAASMLPVVVLFAVLNAVSEEITHRAHAGQPGERRQPENAL